MKINKIYNPKLKEKYIDLYYPEEDAEVRDILNYFSAQDPVLYGKNDLETAVLELYSIYYFEVVDRKCYAYLFDSVWEVDASLQQILVRFKHLGFIRINKSTIVNIYQVDRLKANLNMKVHLVLKNDEVLVLNRSFKKEFFQDLELFRKETEQ